MATSDERFQSTRSKRRCIDCFMAPHATSRLLGVIIELSGLYKRVFEEMQDVPHIIIPYGDDSEVMVCTF